MKALVLVLCVVSWIVVLVATFMPMKVFYLACMVAFSLSLAVLWWVLK